MMALARGHDVSCHVLNGCFRITYVAGTCKSLKVEKREGEEGRREKWREISSFASYQRR